MVTMTSTPRNTQDRGRGLLLVWRRELGQKLQVNNYLPGHSRGYIENHDREDDRQETRGLTVDLRPT